MSEIFFISDLHLGHKNIIDFSRDYRIGETIEDHDDWIVYQWNSVVKKNDMVWILGDVCFTKESLKNLSRMNGTKQLVRGNHDEFPTINYLDYFQNVYGLVKKYGFWLSHAPIHPEQLRGHKNIHGHVHHNSIKDDNYINVSVEVLKGIPLGLREISNP